MRAIASVEVDTELNEFKGTCYCGLSFVNLMDYNFHRTSCEVVISVWDWMEQRVR